MATNVKLEGRDQRYLRLLEDFGHLTPDGADRLCVAVAELMPDAEAGTWEAPTPVPREALRRAAAIVLFQADGADRGALAEDWPLLFS